MGKKFFRILNDEKIINRWHLNEPNLDGTELDVWALTSGLPISFKGSIDVPIQYKGPALDFTFSAFDVPIVSRSLYELIQNFVEKNIQLFPVHIKGYADQYNILHVSTAIKCIDEETSEFIKWRSEDGRPDKIGQIRMLTKLRLNPSLIDEDVHIFRLKEWEIALIVSEKLKQILETSGITGIKYQEV